jgi:hypothetical protein
MATYTNPTGVAPDWTFPTTPANTVTLLAHAAEISGASAVFSYYPYTSSGTVSTTPDTLTGGYLSAAQAANVAAVGVQFEAQPSDGSSTVGSNVDFSDQVDLALSPASSVGTGSTGATTTVPCE